MQRKVWKGMTVLLAASVLLCALTACDDGSGGGGGSGSSVTYSGTAEGVNYVLTITKDAGKAAYSPKSGDGYVLKINNVTKSTGTVQNASGGALTLKPSHSGAAAFTVMVAGAEIAAISGDITADNGAVTPEPPEFTSNRPDGPFNVIYFGNGNTGGTAPIDNFPHANGDTVAILANPSGLSKTGMHFNGWNTKADGTGSVRPTGYTFMITGNTVLYAQWIASVDPQLRNYSMKVTGSSGAELHKSRGKVISSNSVTSSGLGDIITDATLMLENNDYPLITVTLRNGYATGVSGITELMGQSDLTFDIVLTPIDPIHRLAGPFYVSYDLNGGRGIPPLDVKVYPAGGATVLGADTKLVKGSGGAKFGGWNTHWLGARDGGGTIRTIGTEFNVAKDTQLYGQWNVQKVKRWKKPKVGEQGPGGGIIIKDELEELDNKEFDTDEEALALLSNLLATKGFTMADTGEKCHYLEAAPGYIGQFIWSIPRYSPGEGRPDTWPSISTGTAIGTGRKNTADIISADPTAPAALAAKGYTGGGKNDWFLPSLDELKIFVEVTKAINGGYWSSSQVDSFFVYSWGPYGYTNNSPTQKDGNCVVHPIRAFTQMPELEEEDE